MGVKGLWTLLSPTCDKKALWELEGQTVAIDLSCWICDSQTISFAVNRPHLRNLFFRTSCLLLAGIRPVFVLEGKVPEIKQNEIKRRIQNVWNGVETNSRVKDTRPRFNSLIQQCCRLLEALGVNYIQSPGEGEAMCAHLNAAGLVDGCITQDNDCFLYGATTVFRNFSSSRSSKGCGFSVDAYDMAVVQKVLGLNREALVAIALICGCDYEGDECNGRGVIGVGIETAAQFVSSFTKSSQNILSRLKSWTRESYFIQLEREAGEIENVSSCLKCGHRGNLGRHDRVGCKNCDCEKGCYAKCDFSKENSLLNMSLEERRSLMLELGIRKKALVNPKFPSQAIIDEYLTPCNIPIPSPSSISWKRPDLKKFLEFAEKYLGWPEDYSLEKFLPIYSRWKVMHEKSCDNVNHAYEISPICIKKQRTSKGTSYYEVEWKMNPAILQISCFTSLEPCAQFGKAYPVMAEEFQKEKKKPAKKGQKKNQVKVKASKGRCNCGKSAGNQHHMCFFLKKDEKLRADKVEDAKCKSSIEAITRSLVDLDLDDADSSSSDIENIPEIDDEIDPSELSAIVKDIVGISSSPMRNKDDPHKNSPDHFLSMEAGNLKLGTDSSDDDFSEFDIPLYLRARSHVYKTSNCSVDNISSDKEVLSDQIDSANSTIAEDFDKSINELSLNFASTPQNLNRCHHFHPKFSLGVSSLLQSPLNDDAMFSAHKENSTADKE